MSNLRVNYRGTTSQPSISQLLDITDNSDPLNISKGNPGLKPSFTQNFRLFYNNFVQNHNRGVMTFINFSTTNNSISNKVTYDEKTGGRITRPDYKYQITGTGTDEENYGFVTDDNSNYTFNTDTVIFADKENYITGDLTTNVLAAVDAHSGNDVTIDAGSNTLQLQSSHTLFFPDDPG